MSSHEAVEAQYLEMVSVCVCFPIRMLDLLNQGIPSLVLYARTDA